MHAHTAVSGEPPDWRQIEGPGAALNLVEALDLGGYYPFHATRADLLRRLERSDEAAADHAVAAGLAPSTAERDHLSGQAARASERFPRISPTGIVSSEA